MVESREEVRLLFFPRRNLALPISVRTFFIYIYRGKRHKERDEAIDSFLFPSLFSHGMHIMHMADTRCTALFLSTSTMTTTTTRLSL